MGRPAWRQDDRTIGHAVECSHRPERRSGAHLRGHSKEHLGAPLVGKSNDGRAKSSHRQLRLARPHRQLQQLLRQQAGKGDAYSHPSLAVRHTAETTG